jgi:hypothetical protein
MGHKIAQSPMSDLASIEQRIVDFLLAREDKLRSDMVAQQGVARERLVSAMLENYWLRRAVESGELLGDGGR